MENKWFESKYFKSVVYFISVLLAGFLVLAVVQRFHDTIDTFKYKTYPARTLNITGQSKIRATPDTAYFNFTYQAQRDNQETLSKDTENIVNKFKEFLVKQGVKEENITQSQYTLTTYSYEPNPNFQINSSFKAQLPVSAGSEEALKNILKEAQDKKMLSYNYIGCLSFSDIGNVLKQGWQSALSDAYSKAKNLTEVSGQGLGDLISVSDNYIPQTAAGPINQNVYNDSTCSGIPITPSVKIEPIELTSSVSATYGVK